jgi:hypothetical protein
MKAVHDPSGLIGVAESLETTTTEQLVSSQSGESDRDQPRHRCFGRKSGGRREGVEGLRREFVLLRWGKRSGEMSVRIGKRAQPAARDLRLIL